MLKGPLYEHLFILAVPIKAPNNPHPTKFRLFLGHTNLLFLLRMVYEWAAISA